jgi:hypothetical protein
MWKERRDGETIIPRVSYSSHFLLDLPIDVYRELLKYFRSAEIGILDLAILNRQLREVFLSALSGIVLARYDSNVDLLPITWLTQRKILAREIKISDSLDPMLPQCILQSKSIIEVLVLLNTSVKDAEFRQIGFCPKLKSLSLLDYSISPRGLEDFLRMNPQLESLSISRCHHYSDDILVALAGACLYLQHLDISRCNWVTDASLELIGNSPLKLKALDIHLCHVSVAQVRELIKRSSFSTISTSVKLN